MSIDAVSSIRTLILGSSAPSDISASWFLHPDQLRDFVDIEEAFLLLIKIST